MTKSLAPLPRPEGDAKAQVPAQGPGPHPPIPPHCMVRNLGSATSTQMWPFRCGQRTTRRAAPYGGRHPNEGPTPHYGPLVWFGFPLDLYDDFFSRVGFIVVFAAYILIDWISSHPNGFLDAQMDF